MQQQSRRRGCSKRSCSWSMDSRAQSDVACPIERARSTLPDSYRFGAHETVIRRVAVLDHGRSCWSGRLLYVAWLPCRTASDFSAASSCNVARLAASRSSEADFESRPRKITAWFLSTRIATTRAGSSFERRGLSGNHTGRGGCISRGTGHSEAHSWHDQRSC